jgi:hypothetical protein
VSGVVSTTSSPAAWSRGPVQSEPPPAEEAEREGARAEKRRLQDEWFELF